MEYLKEKIRELSEKYFKEVLSIRKHLHAHPELSFAEVNTARFVSAQLKKYGIKHRKGIAKTGIVALIEGVILSGVEGGGKYGKQENRKTRKQEKENIGKTIALRADMDALPILEKNKVPYRSKNQGVMHACGHDVHAACMLGVARIISELRDQFEGTVKIIFQPGEEKLPGGASIMIREGVLHAPKPDTMFAQHVFPQLEVGKVGFRKGKYMASTDEIYITVKGKGGHAAMVDFYINPILIASQILNALNAGFMVPATREIPDIPTVLAFGKIIANGATNVIPDEARLEGTFRTFDETWRSEAHKRIIKLAQKICSDAGGSCDVNIVRGYPFLINDEVITSRAMEYAAEYLGEENVIELGMWMTSEDFAYFSQKVPSCFYRLGVGNAKKGIISPVHSATFTIDEEALKVGMGLMAWITLREMRN